MIAFACSVTAPDVTSAARRPASAGRRADSEVLPLQAAGSIFRELQPHPRPVCRSRGPRGAGHHPQDAEIVDPEFCVKLRRALGDPDVGVVGSVGAVGVRNIAWWEGSVTWASFTHRYEELGGGDLPALSWKREEIPEFAHTGEVDTVDGFVLALTPWTVGQRALRRVAGAGSTATTSTSASRCGAGRKIVTEDLRVVHHHSLDLVSDPETWVAAHIRLAEKWAGRLPNADTAGDEWRQRARRAEAEASLARTKRSRRCSRPTRGRGRPSVGSRR